VQSLASTNETVGVTVQKVTDTTRFSTPFALPLRDNRKISSPFAEVRKTGEERITHLGVDFDQPKGSLVAAINDGVVAKAYVDPTYGNSIYVDHGRGIYSLYLHLDTMRVKAGDVVKKGTIVGTLGESGLASAPHLHLSIKINGTSVDPLQFVGSFR
jgi:murein DD-endopeptidase MepM/ murein hydrolase activator NlpD